MKCDDPRCKRKGEFMGYVDDMTTNETFIVWVCEKHLKELRG